METLRSSIKTDLKTKVLFRGTVFGGGGMLLLLFGGIYIPVNLLEYLGFPLLIMGVGLITWGMKPFRELSFLELNPYEILYDEEKMIFRKKGKNCFTLPIKSINYMSYQENGNDYGISVELKKPPPEKMIVHAQNFDMNHFQKMSRKKWKVDLFFPYFSQKSFDKIKLLNIEV